MQSCCDAGPVAVLVILVVLSFPSGMACSDNSGQRTPQPQSEPSDLTEQFRIHNAISLLRVLGEEAQRGMGVIPEENLLLALNRSPPSDTKALPEAHPEGGDFSVGPSTQKSIVDHSLLYNGLADTLETAKDVIINTSRQLLSIFGLGNESASLLRRWKESGATAAKGAFEKLFGPAEPNPPMTGKKLDQGLASLFQQQQAPTTLYSHADAQQEREHVEQTEPRTLHKLLRSGAAAVEALGGSAEDFTGREGRGASEARPPTLRGLDGDISKQIQKMVSMRLPGSQEPQTPLLDGTLGVEDLQKLFANRARVVDTGDAGSMAGSGLGTALGLAAPLSLGLGLPEGHFGALSLLTKEDTLKNWDTLVKAHEQHGRANYTSKAALDLMERMAVVLGCAYNTAKTLLGEEEANNLIRAAIRQNADFKEQVFSSIKKNLMEGFDPVEEKASATGSSGLGGSVSSEAASRTEIESRLLRDLLSNLLHMPPAFYNHVIRKYRDTLNRWGVTPSELFSIVKEALALSLPPKEKEDTSHATGQ